jgi:tetratricopeptide (TPR) repeat protein
MRGPYQARPSAALGGDRDEYLLNLGFVLQARGALQEAARCFEEALKIDPEYERARESLEDIQAALAFMSTLSAVTPHGNRTR